VNHCVRDVVYHVNMEYTACVTGNEIIKKIEGEVAARDRARAITAASGQAAELLASLKDVSEGAFDKEVAQAQQGKCLMPAVNALLEAKKAVTFDHIAAAKAKKAANEAIIEAGKERVRRQFITTTPGQPSIMQQPHNPISSTVFNQQPNTTQQKNIK
jgi:hypothetical protein